MHVDRLDFAPDRFFFFEFPFRHEPVSAILGTLQPAWGLPLDEFFDV
jgi:hypothetical protein